MLTKKELYARHIAVCGDNALSYNGFSSRLKLGRDEDIAVKTGRLIRKKRVIRYEHKKIFGDKAVTGNAIDNRIARGRTREEAINTPSQGHGGNRRKFSNKINCAKKRREYKGKKNSYNYMKRLMREKGLSFEEAIIYNIK